MSSLTFRQMANSAFERLISASYVSAYRTIGVLIVSQIVCTNVSEWIILALRVSPLLAMLVVISCVFVLGRLWRHYMRDVTSTGMRLILWSARFSAELQQAYREHSLLARVESRVSLKTLRNSLRIAVVFLMAHRSIDPEKLLAWLLTTIAFTIIEVDIPLVNIMITSGDRESVEFWQNIKRVVFDVILVLSVFIHQLYSMSPLYMSVTISYYLLASGLVKKLNIFLLEKIDCFEGLEQIYMEFVCEAACLVFAIVLAISCLVAGIPVPPLLALFLELHPRGQRLVVDTVPRLLDQWLVIAQFPRATPEQIVARHDDVCAVCLTPMTRARVTPCEHMFHGRCLNGCLQHKRACPLCNRTLVGQSAS